MKREILFGFDTAREVNVSKVGKTIEFDLISKVMPTYPPVGRCKSAEGYD